MKGFIKAGITIALDGIRESSTDESDGDLRNSSDESLDTDDCNFEYVVSADDSAD